MLGRRRFSWGEKFYLKTFLSCWTDVADVLTFGHFRTGIVYIYLGLICKVVISWFRFFRRKDWMIAAACFALVAGRVPGHKLPSLIDFLT
jgi:hypothetical protein